MIPFTSGKINFNRDNRKVQFSQTGEFLLGIPRIFTDMYWSFLILIIAVDFLFTSCDTIAHKNIAEFKPNVILILVDDLGYSDVAYAGMKPEIQTPNIDKLRKYGMFIHFGLYSQLGGEWKGKQLDNYAEWIQANADIAAQEYTMLVTTFNPKKFDADLIAETAKNMD